jgi:hypothetical protein
MSVTKYHDVADMPAPPRGDPADPATFARIKQLGVHQSLAAVVPARRAALSFDRRGVGRARAGARRAHAVSACGALARDI